MAESHKFRREFRGFNREDVVRYIEYMNKKNTNLVNQLKAENQGLKDELAALRAASADLEKDAMIASLQAHLEELQAQPQPPEPTDSELEAYRRAERMERVAKERADLIYQQATATLSEATLQVDTAAQHFGTIAENINDNIRQLQAAVDSSKAALQDAAATMYAIRPEASEE